MANVSWDRGQMILVSGLLVAVTLLVLVLLLNTAIYTENVATRGIDSDADLVDDVQVVMDREIPAILKAHEPVNDRETLENNSVGESVDYFIEHQATLTIERGIVKNSTATITPGIILTAAEHDDSDRLVRNAETFRRFSFDIDTSGMENERIDLVGGDWSLVLNVTQDESHLEDDVGEPITSWQTDESVHIDLINETIDGDSCECELVGPDGLPPGTENAVDLTVYGNESAETNIVTVGTGIETNDSDARWYADSVEVELVILGPDIRYETTRTYGGEIPS